MKIKKKFFLNNFFFISKTIDCIEIVVEREPGFDVLGACFFFSVNQKSSQVFVLFDFFFLLILNFVQIFLFIILVCIRIKCNLLIVTLFDFHCFSRIHTHAWFSSASSIRNSILLLFQLWRNVF